MRITIPNPDLSGNFTVEQAAEILGVHRKTLDHEAERGNITPCIEIPGGRRRKLWPIEAINDFHNLRAQKPSRRPMNFIGEWPFMTGQANYTRAFLKWYEDEARSRFCKVLSEIARQNMKRAA